MGKNLFKRIRAYADWRGRSVELSAEGLIRSVPFSLPPDPVHVRTTVLF
jgi:hypothetical protein